MGDLSTEPSMEEILSSIKRIIAEEGDGAPQRGRRPSRAPLSAAAQIPAEDDDEVLELSDPMPPSRPAPEPTMQPQRIREPQPVEQRMVAPPQPSPAAHLPEPARPERIVSPEAAAASRGALDMLSRLMVKPEPGSDGSLEGLVREMLRPMLREWLDANLPELVETMVAREIKRITGQAM